MSNPEYQSLDPAGAPDPVTPAGTPADDPGWAMVTPDGEGPAPYGIQAAMDEAAITAAFDAAGAVSGAGIVYPPGTRQSAAEVLLSSPAGFSAGGGTSGYDIPQGWSGEPDESWANNTQVSSILETPVQGEMGMYPADSTMQDGLTKYGTS